MELTTSKIDFLLHPNQLLAKKPNMGNSLKYKEIDLVAHARNMEYVRKLHKLSQSEVAEIIGMNRASYNNIVNQHGQYKLNQVSAANFMRNFQVDFFWLFFNEGTYEESHEKFLLAEKRSKTYTEDTLKLQTLEEKTSNYERIEKELNDKVNLQSKVIGMLEDQVKQLKAQLEECEGAKKTTPKK